MPDVSIVRTLVDRDVRQTVIYLVVQVVKMVHVLVVVKVVHVLVIVVMLHVVLVAVTIVKMPIVDQYARDTAVALLVLLTVDITVVEEVAKMIVADVETVVMAVPVVPKRAMVV
jgi:hypothetical protein